MHTPLFPKPKLRALIGTQSQPPELRPAAPSAQTQTLTEIQAKLARTFGLNIMRNATVNAQRHDLVVTPSTQDMRVIATVDLSARRGISIDIPGQAIHITTPVTDLTFAIDSITNFVKNQGERNLFRLAYATIEGRLPTT